MCPSISASCVSGWRSCDKHMSNSPLEITLPELDGMEERSLFARHEGARLVSRLPAATSECVNAPGRKDRAARLGWHPLWQTQLTGWVPRCLHLAHGSTSGQRLPQPPQSWIRRDTLLLTEKTTLCSFQSGWLVRNNDRARGKPPSTASSSFSHAELRSCC